MKIAFGRPLALMKRRKMSYSGEQHENFNYKDVLRDRERLARFETLMVLADTTLELEEQKLADNSKDEE